jgi:hypothetical protein
MQTARKKNLNKAHLVLALTLSTAVLLGGCGKEKDASVLPAGSFSPTGNFQNVPAEVQHALLGGYAGRLYKLNDIYDQVLQDFTFDLAPARVEGNPSLFALLKFRTAGMSFDVPIDMVVKAYTDAAVPGVSFYAFRSRSAEISGIRSSYASVQLVIALRGTTFEPTRSGLRIMDCGFSQGVDCSYPVSDPVILDPLRKR